MPKALFKYLGQVSFAHRHIRPQYDFQGHGVRVSLSSLTPKYPVFVVKIVTTPVEMPKLPERVDYHVNNTFTQVKISDQHE